MATITILQLDEAATDGFDLNYGSDMAVLETPPIPAPPFFTVVQAVELGGGSGGSPVVKTFA